MLGGCGQPSRAPCPPAPISPYPHQLHPARNSVSVHIQNFDLQATYFDGDVISGIVPFLFSCDPVANRAAPTAILLGLKSPKSADPRGEFLDLFSFLGYN